MEAEIVMDVGKSLNPAIDIGQIEGAFVQVHQNSYLIAAFKYWQCILLPMNIFLKITIYAF